MLIFLQNLLYYGILKDATKLKTYTGKVIRGIISKKSQKKFYKLPGIPSKNFPSRENISLKTGIRFPNSSITLGPHFCI